MGQVVYLSHLYKLYGLVHTYTGIFNIVLSVWFGLSDIEVSKIQHSALMLRCKEKTGALSLLFDIIFCIKFVYAALSPRQQQINGRQPKSC